MNKSHKTVDDIYETLTGDVIETEPRANYGLATALSSRQGKLMLRNAQLAGVHDYCCAAFSSTALRHVGALSMMELQLNQMAPQGRARYEAIINSYTQTVVRAIDRF